MACPAGSYGRNAMATSAASCQMCPPGSYSVELGKAAAAAFFGGVSSIPPVIMRSVPRGNLRVGEGCEVLHSLPARKLEEGARWRHQQQ